jgi:hypothetical protein
MRATLFSLLLLVACADPYGDAEKLNTIEGWEQYLASDAASGSQKSIAEDKLAKLLAEKARSENTVAAFDGYLTRFPQGTDADDMKKARAVAAFAAAEDANTAAGWKAFLEENPTAEAALQKKADAFRQVAEYGGVKVEAPTVKQVNLAHDPKGPLNGWQVATTVTNTGDATIKWLNLTVYYLDASGKRLTTKSYPVVAETGPGGMPIEEKFQKPLEPGKSRAWEYETEEVPKDWAQTAQVVASGIRLEAGAK